jgi:hypothetical protein
VNLKEYSAIANSTREVVEHFYLSLLGAKVARLDPPHREAFVRDARRALPSLMWQPSTHYCVSAKAGAPR